MQGQGVLETLLSRLESVAERLEASSGVIVGGGAGTTTARSGGGGLTAPPATSAAPQVAQPAVPGGPTPSLQEYGRLIDPAIAALLQAAQPLGQEVQQASQLVDKAFKAQQAILQAVSQCKKPSNAELGQLLEPVAQQIRAAHAATEGRRGASFNHQKTVADALNALTWLAYTGPGCGSNLPAQHIDESWQSAQFWANKVMMEFRGSNPQHGEWVKALQQVLMQLKAYVKQHHLAGPAWQPNGVPLAQWKPPANAAAAPAAAGAAPSAAAPKPAGSKGPTPPPPPPAGSLFEQPKAAAPAAGNGAGAQQGMSAVLAALSKGDGVTTGLRKVTDDMKTKNRTDRSSVVPVTAAGSTPADGRPAAAAAAAQQRPPRLELEQGRKWCVESHSGNRELVVADTSPKQTVYIFGCTNSTVQVKGKVNAITLDSCSRTGLVFQDLVASCEVVNCQSVQVQCTGVMNTLTVDKTDGIMLYLSAQSLGVAITTAKSSEINVVLPAQGDADPVELPVPEQFVSFLRDGKLITEPVSHSGG